MGQQVENDFLMTLSDLCRLLQRDRKEIVGEIKKLGHSLIIQQRQSFVAPSAVRALLEQDDWHWKPKVVSVQMLKGGVAKTTSALNIGLRAAMYGLKVLMVDLDQQANLSFSLGFENEEAPVWVDLLEGQVEIEDCIHSMGSQLDLIPSSLNNSVLDRVLLNGARNFSLGVKKYLDPIASRYDLVIIDTAPNLSAINTAAACASDLILLPVNPDRYSFTGLEKTLEELGSIREEFGASFRESILFTKYDGRERASRELLESCFHSHEELMLKNFIRTSAEVKNTIGSGQTIFDSKNNAKEDYDSVTRELIQL